jgi:hypothetical protein
MIIFGSMFVPLLRVPALLRLFRSIFSNKSEQICSQFPQLTRCKSGAFACFWVADFFLASSSKNDLNEPAARRARLEAGLDVLGNNAVDA